MKCISCNIEMLESTEKRIIRVNMIGHPTEDLQVINIGVKKPTLFSGKDEFKDVNLKCRVCPNCGMMEKYITSDDLQKLFG